MAALAGPSARSRSHRSPTTEPGRRSGSRRSLVGDAVGRDDENTEPIGMTTRPLPTSSTSQDIVQRLAALGARYDAAPLFPVDSLAALTCAGLHRRFAPRAAGGEVFADEAARNAALADSLRLVGQGDLSIGRLFEGHVNALCLFDWYATRDQLDWLDRALTEGAWFGVWATEPSPGVQLDDDGITLKGAKTFASGAGGLTYALVTVASVNGARRLAIVPADHAGRAGLAGWGVRGVG